MSAPPNWNNAHDWAHRWKRLAKELTRRLVEARADFKRLDSEIRHRATRRRVLCAKHPGEQNQDLCPCVAFSWERAEGLERELAEARAVVGEAWFAGGATLAEAIERKCRTPIEEWFRWNK